ncbi:prepilin-type N-terminal cleavage/methylation domain-containing protein [Massilia sp. YIM B02443]|uniref:prepilin-type N-terminal cleavage/methylation domain-containing protein n=1 Tax=Massilia sp. YIM B02443 TaxID=3050127 RepID=UPI0025B6BE12|nr:prepilin-type N-terminal cleavage/methylation domain-containing protein [Massilia sp. YIM B02443]MDN4035530.1 prepilin-type N-terminal cleavage/methylation domain-containing protein [Massilia sp. YIM B02443]
MPCRVRTGYTLIELMLVLAILAIAAAVALPSAQPVAGFGADAAAGEVALALRFARDDARRSGQSRLFACNPAAATATVRSIDTDKDNSVVSNAAPWYSAALAPIPAANQIAIVSCTFTFTENPSSAATFAFDASGNPVRGIGKGPARTQRLRSGAVVIGDGATRRTITLDASGRITLS